MAYDGRLTTMPVLVWLITLVSSTATLTFHLVVSSALFLLSAFALTLPQDDGAALGYVVRAIAALWLWAALRHYVVRGVLQRAASPKRVSKKTPTGLEAVLGTLGCLGSIAAMIGLFAFVGEASDWALAGIRGADPTHPARVAFDAGLRTLEQGLVDPEPFIGYLIAVPFLLVGLSLASTWAQRQARGHGADSRSSRQTRTASGKARSPEKRPAAAAPARSTFDDPVLGRVQWEGGTGRWRVAEPRGKVGALWLDTGGEAPSERQLLLARNVVQRDFEVLLRASEAARAAAQSRGVALPRFTVSEATVLADAQPSPTVAMTLRCEGDAHGSYAVQSSDGMNTFTLSR